VRPAPGIAGVGRLALTGRGASIAEWRNRYEIAVTDAKKAWTGRSPLQQRCSLIPAGKGCVTFHRAAGFRKNDYARRIIRTVPSPVCPRRMAAV
jgi:hypothetical protein